jgi:uncharacterized protein (DUF1015 family)
MRLHPFASLLPAPGQAARVASPPYDVVSRSEARSLAAGNPNSFLHVGRADADLPDSVDPYDPRVYQCAREALDRFTRDGVLRRDATPGLYLYRQIMNGQAQTGLVGCVHIDDYEQDLIKKHEKTRPDKEDDRTRHILALNAQAEPVFLAYRPDPALDQLAATDSERTALFDFTSSDGVRHVGWRVLDASGYIRAFTRVPAAYVADGHHRTASAWRAGSQRRAANPEHTGSEEYNWFLAVLFPASELRILAYNRLVQDLAGHTLEGFLNRLRGIGRLGLTTEPAPIEPGTFGMYLDGRWYRLELDLTAIVSRDPLAALDVSLLQERVLGPLLKIGDPRTAKRIDFVGGIRGTEVLEERVNSGSMAVGFALFPTTMDQLLRVADAGLMMPPKSTWFEPKLRSGLFVHTLDPLSPADGASA